MTEAVRAKAVISLGPVLEEADVERFDEGPDVPIAETTLRRVRKALRGLFEDDRAPKEVRRRALEAAVRAPESWQEDAVRAAFSSGEAEWRLTAAFCMRFLRGFEAEIMEALEDESPDVLREAVLAAGEEGVRSAWARVAALLTSKTTAKPLLLASIEASTGIHPHQASAILPRFLEAKDVEIAEAASDALILLEGGEGADDTDDEEDAEGSVEVGAAEHPSQSHPPRPRNLYDVLTTAIELRVSSVLLEHDSAGELEVWFVSGEIGTGVSVPDRAARRRILEELERRTRFDVRGRATFEAEVAGVRWVVRVRMRDHFGDAAYDLQLERAPHRGG